MPSDSRPFGNTVRALFEKHDVSWQRHLHITDHQMIARRVVAASDAFGLTSEEVTMSDGFGDNLAALPAVGLFKPFHLCCATRARWELSKPVLAFLRAMRLVPAGAYDSKS